MSLSMNIFLVLFVTLVGFLVKESLAFTPGDDFDIGPNDLDALCPMFEQFVGGTIPKTVQIKDAPDPKECVYFKWTWCPGKQDMKNPCGFYTMTKCPAARRKRDVSMNHTVPDTYELPEMDDLQGSFINFSNF